MEEEEEEKEDIESLCKFSEGSAPRLKFLAMTELLENNGRRYNNVEFDI